MDTSIDKRLSHRPRSRSAVFARARAAARRASEWSADHPRLTFLLACIVAGPIYLALSASSRSMRDFDLYYFAAMAERSGTYTDFAAVGRLMTEAGIPVPLNNAFGTPMLVALLFIPLTFLPLTLAHGLFMLGSTVLTCLGLRKMVARPSWPLWLIPLLASPVALLGSAIGNMSVWTTALTLYVIGALMARQSTRAGVVLGLLIAMKLYPALLVLPLLMTRQWRAVAAASLTGVLTTLVSTLVLGWHDMVLATADTLHLGGFVYESSDNVSLPSWVLLLTQNETAGRLVGAGALVVTVVLVVLRRRADTAALTTLTVCLMLLGQSITWRHYTPVAIAAVILVASHAQSTRRFKVTVAVAYVLVVQIPIGYLAYEPISHALASFGAMAGLVVLCLAMLNTTAIADTQPSSLREDGNDRDLATSAP